MNNDLHKTAVQVDEKRRRLLSCIDTVLNKFGPEVRRALTFYMRRNYSLKRYQIPDKPQEFSVALHHVFGKSAGGIERRIRQAIIEEFQLSPETETSLEEVIRSLVKP